MKSTMSAATLLAILFHFVAPEARAEALAIVGGTIIDGNGGKPISNGVIVIEGKRIVAVGSDPKLIPPGARRIAAEGKYVMPGLMDANVHLFLDISLINLIRYQGRYDELAIEAAQVALKSGITTVFDTWGPRQYLMKARKAINDGSVVGSRIFLAGNIVGLHGPISEDFLSQGAKALLPPGFTDQVNAIWQENVGPDLMTMSPNQVRVEIRKYVNSGIDFMKYAVTAHLSEDIEFSPRVQKVFVDEAHRAGILVETHTLSVEGVDLAIEAGVDLMQHCELTLKHPLPAETVALIAKRHIPCAILPRTTQGLTWYRDQYRGKPPTVREVNLNDLYEIADLNERALMQAGADLLLSTDGGVRSPSGVAEPPDDLWILGEGEFSWLVAVEQKGMKPMDALMAATRNIARAYKVDKDLGTLEKGKLADLVILDRNPLAGAANYRSIGLVMKEGELVDRDALPTHKLLTAPAMPGPT